MAELDFRDAVAADLPAIVAMYADDEIGTGREEVRDPLPDGYGLAFQAIADDPRHRLLVAEEAGQVVATLQLSFLPQLTNVGSERAQIEAVRVLGPRRGNGIGRMLVQRAIDLARERGCGMVQLTSNAGRADARRFYESLGFVPSHVGFKLTL
jgi:GNAT superfamily N-acetyltransferase